MTLLLETGTGLLNANSYILPAFITTYLADRNRDTENSWDTLTIGQQEAACIAGTDFIDTRWGHRLKGIRKSSYAGVKAQGQLAFSGLPLDTETITVGEKTYMFVATLNFFSSTDILIGATVDETVLNTMNAINGTADGIIASASLEANEQASAILREGTTTDILLTAREIGSAGNDIPLSQIATNVTVTSVFVNGQDGGSQAREFPRLSMYNQDGEVILGIPIQLKEATAEYAIRAAAEALWFDPVVDEGARTVTERWDIIGPIEERRKFEPGTTLSQIIKPYPAADRLMRDFLVPSGRAIR